MANNLREVRVQARSVEAPAIVSFRLCSLVPDRPLPSFEAGAHIDVQLPDGSIRQYSLANDPAETGVFEIAVKLEEQSRGGSAWLHSDVSVGDVIKVGPPRNLFPLVRDSEPVTLIAGGIGITPIMAMVRTLLRENKRFELHYFARAPEIAAYLQTLLRETNGLPVVKPHFGLDADATRAALQQIIKEDMRGHLYFCGPAPFMSTISEVAKERNLESEKVHFEYFSAPKNEAEADNQNAFEVEIASTGQVLTVPPDKSITDVLFENSVAIDTSCEEGTCGSCRTRIISGTPIHRDVVLSKAEKERNDCLLPCVSRSASKRLVLDL